MKKYTLVLFILNNLCVASITKVIIPAAGLGTRFLPITKAIPKEMVPIGNKPAIHYVFTEALESGINNIALIMNKQKTTIKDYLSTECSPQLKNCTRYNIITETQKIFQSIHFSYINQNEPRGTGDAVLKAEKIIGNSYFGIMYPDDIIFGDIPAIGQLIKIAEREKASVIAVQEVPYDQVCNYGVVKIKKEIDENTFEIDDVVEKPKISEAPSNLAIIGRYVFSPKIFSSLKEIEKNLISGELQLTDGIAYMMHHAGEKVIAYKIRGTRYDTGTPLGWIKAVIGQAMQNDEYKDDIALFLQNEFKSATIHPKE